ncbi:hypothetical protein [Sphingobium yanoikuyae]|uniref:hypothetical protein n=1 Tax=Sphingobium yanoikuyae TaxID=13690 RepID=UPI0035C82944
MTAPLTPAQRSEAEFDLTAARAEIGDRLRNQMSFAEKAMAALMVANGGALVGLFTFIGNVVGKSDAKLRFDTTLLWAAFACFALGVALVLTTHLFAFLSQVNFYNQAAHEMWRHQRTLAHGAIDEDRDDERRSFILGTRMMIVGIVTLLLSLFCFMTGSGLSLAGVLPA